MTTTTFTTFKGYEVDAATAKAVLRAKKGCPHCQSKAEAVNCHRCNRDMCKDCISMFGGAPVCGSCYDELIRITTR